MALMALLSWRGLDGIGRTQSRLQQRSDEVLTLQATLAQWSADLDAMTPQPNLPGLEWDGRSLRILRRGSIDAADGLRVVAWALRVVDGQGHWLRWLSPPLQNRADLDLAWQKAAIWAQTPSDEDRLREVRTVPLDSWQIFYYRSNAWTNPLSSADSDTAASTGTASTLPDGARLRSTSRVWMVPRMGKKSCTQLRTASASCGYCAAIRLDRSAWSSIG